MNARRHEPDQVATGTLWRLGLLFAAILVALLVAMIALWRALMPPSPAAMPVPPGARLQARPLEDWQRIVQAQRARRDGYAWEDPQHRYARIPVARAMQRLAEQSPAEERRP